MCARHGRGAIEICLSEKGALAKKYWETLTWGNQTSPWSSGQCCHMVPNLANIAKNHYFPNNLPIFLAILYFLMPKICQFWN